MNRLINEMYNEFLTDIEQIIGVGTTGTNQLTQMAKTLFNSKYKGTYPSDHIPSSFKYCIVNIDDSSKGGTHWVALVRAGKKTYVYDSFGRQTTKIFPNVKSLIKSIMVDNDAEQAKQELNCGQRCIAFLSCIEVFGIAKAVKYL